MAKLTIVGEKELREKLRRLGQAVVSINREAAEAAAEIVRAEAAQRAPGPYIDVELVKADENRAEVDIGPDEKHWYYRFLETGATAHEIAGSPLVFQGSQGLVVTKKVQHTGFPAAPFLRPALRNRADDARETAGKTFRAAIERVANGS